MPIPGEVLTPPGGEATGGIVVAADGSPAGSLINGPGQLQFGPMLVADGTPLMWSELENWRGISTDFNDSPLPSSHGDRAGTILAQGLIVTLTAQLNVEPVQRRSAISTIELYTRVRDDEVALVVNDGAGTEFRMARVIARELPDTIISRLGADRPAIQFKCADPRRYSLTARSVRLDPPSSLGGLEYPLEYPLEYGTVVGGTSTVTNGGNVDSPALAVLRGPLVRPRIRVGDRLWTFDISLTGADRLSFDGRTGQVLLNGVSDRSQNVTDDSDLLEDFMVPPGSSVASLSATSGDGYAVVSFHDARM